MIKDNIIYNSFLDWEMDISKAENDLLWDATGKMYIDFTSGWNVVNLGWNNKEVFEEFLTCKNELNSCIWTGNHHQKEFAKELSKYLPAQMSVFGKATGGTEANEEAIKTARAFTGRKKIVGFKNSYHGQSIQTMSLGFSAEEMDKISSPNSDYIQMDFPNLYRTAYLRDNIIENFSNKLEEVLLHEDVAAIVTEAGIITGWGSAHVAPDSFTSVVRRLTKKYGTLWILDEVGTGFSRCGKLFGFQINNQEPDIITMAKGSTNGIQPLGTMATTDKIAAPTLEKTNMTSTFGWNPLACKIALKVLNIHNRDKVWEKSELDGKHVISVLEKEVGNLDYIGNIRGLGMEIGIDFVEDKLSERKNTPFLERVLKECFSRGLHLVSDHESTIQIMPPLTIVRLNLDKGLDILIEVIKQLHKNV